jgi:hypothetical protein
MHMDDIDFGRFIYRKLKLRKIIGNSSSLLKISGEMTFSKGTIKKINDILFIFYVSKDNELSGLKKKQYNFLIYFFRLTVTFTENMQSII